MADVTPFLQRSALRLLKRCVQCPEIAPSCPTCSSDEVCTTTIGDCFSCSSAKCVKTSMSGSTNASNSLGGGGPNVAAIAGGVAGGILAIAIVVFFIWKFWLKGRRREIQPEELWDEDLPPEKAGSNAQFGQMRAARSSTHTVNSLASTVLTRASNVIQIAYIPGVTQRDPHSPDMLVPPVPPIPIPSTPSTLGKYDGEQRFFVPHIRDSQWSDSSSMMTTDVRKSVASSLARASIGTTIYQDNAIANPMPATAISRGNINVVSVKSGNSNVTTPAESPASASVEFSAQKASIASSAASRPVIVKMLGGGDALRPKGTLPAVSTAKSMKPVALNILRNGSAIPSTPPSELSGSPPLPHTGALSSVTSPQTSPSTTLVSSNLSTKSKRSIKRPETNMSLSSVATSHLSRARLSMANSHRTLGVDDDSDDEDLEEGVELGNAHERSRRSLLISAPIHERRVEEEVDEGPFGDAAGLRGTPVQTPSREDKRRSPFGDDNAI